MDTLRHSSSAGSENNGAGPSLPVSIIHTDKYDDSNGNSTEPDDDLVGEEVGCNRSGIAQLNSGAAAGTLDNIAPSTSENGGRTDEILCSSGKIEAEDVDESLVDREVEVEAGDCEPGAESGDDVALVSPVDDVRETSPLLQRPCDRQCQPCILYLDSMGGTKPKVSVDTNYPRCSLIKSER